MPENTTRKLTADDVLDRVRVELDQEIPATSKLERRIARVRSMQRGFREQPIGGRLLLVKRVLYWFTASAFDRQAKVIEALLDLVEELAEENQRLSLEVARASKICEEPAKD